MSERLTEEKAYDIVMAMVKAKSAHQLGDTACAEISQPEPEPPGEWVMPEARIPVTSLDENWPVLGEANS